MDTKKVAYIIDQLAQHLNDETQAVDILEALHEADIISEEDNNTLFELL